MSTLAVPTNVDTRMASGPLTSISNLSEPLVDKKGDTRKQLAMTGVVGVVVYIVASIISSVFIVLCNKEVFQHGFPFPLTMSWIAYVFTWLYYVAMKGSGAWVPQKDEATGKDKSLPMIENIKVALSSISSISFMNLCLLTNTVAIYQICKFATIPCTLGLHYFVFNKVTNWRVLASIVFILGGVGYSSFKGFEAGNLGVKGIIFALLAVVSTSLYRIWQETKQKEFKLGPVDFQATMAGWQAILGLGAAVVTEFIAAEQDNTVIDWLGNAFQEGLTPHMLATLAWMFGVCAAALTVNFTSFGLIGKTGPVAYAVVGHAKTIFTIILGIVMFPQQETPATIRADIVGCAIAFVGVVAYTHFEYCFKNNKPDWVEKNIPSLVSNKVAPAGNAAK